MKWIYFLARKFFSTRKGIRLGSTLAILGVALGVAVLLLTQSVLTGFEKVFRETLLGFNAHLVVLKFDEMEDPQAEVQDILKTLGKEVVAFTPFLYRESLLVAGGNVKGAAIKGVDPLTFEKVYGVSFEPLSKGQAPATIENLLQKGAGLPKVVLGKDLAHALGVSAQNSQVKIFLPRSEGASGHRFQSFRVAGTFTTGLREFDKDFAFVDIEEIKKLFNINKLATGIEFKLAHPDKAEILASGLQKRLDFGYDAVSWQRLNASLFEALRTDRALFFVIMAMVVLVAAFNIVGVLLLMIFDKSREISILRALGSPRRGLKRLFALQGLWIGALGCFWGVLLGVLAAWLLQVFDVFRLPKEVYLIEVLPVELSPMVVLSVVGASLLIAYAATQFAVLQLHRSNLDL